MRPACAPLLLATATVAAADAEPWRLPDGPLTDDGLTALFAGWKAQWHKSYATPEEEARRFGVFADNMRWVAAGPRGTHGATAFADQTEAEFRASYLRPLTDEDERREAAERAAREKWDGESCDACLRFPEMERYHESTTGASLDWSTKGAVVRPKDQGQCNSCFAFGASGDIEGAWFMAGNALTSVSEQMMLDCSGHGGCSEHSGTRSELFKYVIDNGGVVAENTYPYTARAEACQTAKTTPLVVSIDSYLQISDSADGEDQIFKAVTKLGPICIGISAVRMELYGGGIIDGSCNTKHDHAPVIVGYGTAGSQDYWKVKNSWGSYWGEGGYFRIVRGQNMCGMATDALHTKVGGGKRYTCNQATYQCTAGARGHASMDKCKAACQPTPPPPPPTPLPPTPPPTPPITRYHCLNETAQCYEVPPGHPPGGHSTLEQCESKCYSKGGYVCNATAGHCQAVQSGGQQLHVCQAACHDAPTPVPVWTPAPPPPTPPPTPTPPFPPAPAGEFLQVLCNSRTADRQCTDCQTSDQAMNSCGTVTDGGSIIATVCNSSGLYEQHYTTNDCTGAFTSKIHPIGKCALSKASGKYIERFCGGSAP